MHVVLCWGTAMEAKEMHNQAGITQAELLNRIETVKKNNFIKLN